MPNTITSPQHPGHSASVTEPSQSNSCINYGTKFKILDTLIVSSIREWGSDTVLLWWTQRRFLTHSTSSPTWHITDEWQYEQIYSHSHHDSFMSYSQRSKVFLITEPTRCTNFSKFYSWNETLHVSDGSSVHHRSFSLYSQQWYVI